MLFDYILFCFKIFLMSGKHIFMIFYFERFLCGKKNNKTERLETYEYIGPKASRSSRSCGREWESLCCRSTGGIDRCELQVKYKTLTSSRQNERYSASMSTYGIKNLKIIFNIFKWLLNQRLSMSLLDHLHRKFWSQGDDLKNTFSRSQY